MEIQWNDCQKPAVQRKTEEEEIGGHKPPGHNPHVSGKAGRNPQDIRTPEELEHNVRCRFYVTGKGVLKAKFQDWRTKLTDITPWFRTPCQGGSETGYVQDLHPPILKFSFQVSDL